MFLSKSWNFDIHHIFSAIDFLLLFSFIIIVLNAIDYFLIFILNLFFSDTTFVEICSFLILHSILPFLFLSWHLCLWILLTVAHGLVHIVQPSFYSINSPNFTYNPLYDFIIHSAQCLSSYYYYPSLFPIGVFFSINLMIGAAIAYIKFDFLTTPLWVFMSFGGVFGTQHHMMLLQNNIFSDKHYIIYCTSLFIWTLPYIGYLIFFYNIPYWDLLMHSSGLFRTWYLGFYFTYYFYMTYGIIPIHA